jgi:hypothetical protein
MPVFSWENSQTALTKQVFQLLLVRMLRIPSAARIIPVDFRNASKNATSKQITQTREP